MTTRSTYERNASDPFGGLRVRLVVVAALAAALGGVVVVVAERERLLGEAAARAEALLSEAAPPLRPGEWVLESDGEGGHRAVSGVVPEHAVEPALALAGSQALRHRTGRVLRSPAGGGMIVVRSDGRSLVAGSPVLGLGAAVRLAGLVAVLSGAGFALGGVWLTGRTRRAVRRAARRLGAAVTRVGKTERPRDLPQDGPREFVRLVSALESTLGSLTERVSLLATQRSEAKAILRSMPGAVIALDLDQRVMNTNRVAERLLNLDPDAVRGRLLQEAVRQPALLRFADSSTGAADLRSDEFALRGAPERIVAASSRPLLDAEGSLAGVVIVLQDVTRLRKLESLRRDFASNASHELRTPVTNILGYIETLDECAEADAEDRARFIAIIRRNAERLSAIIEDMLELARLETPDSGGLRGLAYTDARELLEDVAGSFGPDVERKRITIEIVCEKGAAAELNRGLVTQAIGNLLANAIRYSPEGTTIRLGGASLEEQGQVQFSVEDEGPGIPEEHLSRLFERFYRVDPARSREMGGTGLGLAIAKHVAILHGGEIGVTSEVGQGSRFWVRIPRRPEAR